MFIIQSKPRVRFKEHARDNEETLHNLVKGYPYASSRKLYTATNGVCCLVILYISAEFIICLIKMNNIKSGVYLALGQYTHNEPLSEFN